MSEIAGRKLKEETPINLDYCKGQSCFSNAWLQITKRSWNDWNTYSGHNKTKRPEKKI